MMSIIRTLRLCSALLFYSSYYAPTAFGKLQCWKCRDSSELDRSSARTFIKTSGTSCDELESVECLENENFCLSGMLNLTPKIKFLLSGCYADSALNSADVVPLDSSSDLSCDRHTQNFTIAAESLPTTVSYCVCRTPRCNDAEFSAKAMVAFSRGRSLHAYDTINSASGISLIDSSIRMLVVTISFTLLWPLLQCLITVS